MRNRLQISLVLAAMLVLQSFTTHSAMGDTTVYIVSTGKVYHSTKSCRGLKNSKHKIQELRKPEDLAKYVIENK